MFKRFFSASIISVADTRTHSYSHGQRDVLICFLFLLWFTLIWFHNSLHFHKRRSYHRAKISPLISFPHNRLRWSPILLIIYWTVLDAFDITTNSVTKRKKMLKTFSCGSRIRRVETEKIITAKKVINIRTDNEKSVCSVCLYLFLELSLALLASSFLFLFLLFFFR